MEPKYKVSDKLIIIYQHDDFTPKYESFTVESIFKDPTGFVYCNKKWDIQTEENYVILDTISKTKLFKALK